MIIKGPSGVAFEARKFRGREIQKVADRIEEGAGMSEMAMCTLLAACWLRTVDVGPYVSLDPESVPNFYNDVLKADIPGLLLNLRAGSFRRGDEYTFDVRCEDASCGERITWHTNLAKHVLPRSQGLSAAAVAYLESGTLIPIKLLEGPDGKPHMLGMRLTTLAEEEPTRKFLSQQVKRRKRKSKQQLLADRIASQLVTVDGQKMTSIAHRLNFCADLSMDDLYDVRDKIDAHECDVDTAITVKCHECKWEFDVQLPFGQSFLDPTSVSRRERRFGLLDEERPENESSNDTTKALPSETPATGQPSQTTSPLPSSQD